MKSLALLCALAACTLQLGATSALPKPHQAAALPKPVVQPPPVHPAKQSADNDAAAFVDLCSQGTEWVRYGDSCYRFSETSTYWYVAEQECKSHNGHLTSIADHAENSFVAKLTYCESAWIGRYAINVDRLNEPGNYRWTDGTNSNSTTYHAHDFTSITSIHEPLISVKDQKWRNNVYHAKDSFVCKVKTPPSGGGSPTGCPSGWKHLNGSCYMMPTFTATVREAVFHCSKYNSFLVSVYNPQELRSLSLLDLSSDGCPPNVWLGLVKVNPCNDEMFRVRGTSACYKWDDRLQIKHIDFPAWHAGHPLPDDDLEGVLLTGRVMMTVKSHLKNRFICKKPAA